MSPFIHYFTKKSFINSLKKIAPILTLSCFLFYSNLCLADVHPYQNQPNGFFNKIPWGSSAGTLNREEFSLNDSYSDEKGQHEVYKKGSIYFHYINDEFREFHFYIIGYKNYLEIKETLFYNFGEGEEVVKISSSGKETPNGIFWFGDVTCIVLAPYEEDHSSVFFFDAHESQSLKNKKSPTPSPDRIVKFVPKSNNYF